MSKEKEATLLLKIKAAGGEILDHLVITAGDIAHAFEKVIDTIVDFAKESIEAYRESELASNQLTQAMMNQGAYSSELKTKYDEQAEALQKVTTYQADQITQMQTTLQGFTRNKEVTEELQKATLDLAAAKKMDLVSAANMMGRALEGNVMMMQRMGLEVEKSKDQHQQLVNVIKAVEDRFHGQAEVMAEGLGVVDQAKTSWHSFMENVGGAIAPMVEKLAQGAKAVTEFFNSFFSKDLSKMNVNELSVQILKARGEIQKYQDQLATLPGHTDRFIESEIAAAEKRIVALKASREKIIEDEQISANRSGEIARQHNIELEDKDREHLVRKQDLILEEQNMQGQNVQQQLMTQIKMLDDKVKNEENAAKRVDLIHQRANLVAKERDAMAKDQMQKAELTHQQAVNNIIQAGANLAQAVGDANSKAIFLIQKGAALAGAIVATNLAEAQALATPPAPNLALQGLARTAGYINIAAIGASAIKGLAEGGIVTARSGGMPAIIGEGGRDEAVIPLDDPRTQERLGGMGGLTVNFYGSFLGNEHQAMEVAKVIDRAFLQLRKTNQSVAFDSDLF